MIIDVVMDTVCPWCYIGKRRLEHALSLRPDIPVQIRWRPFLLNPEIPPQGIDRTAYLFKKFGSEARIKRVYGAIADTGLTVEIDFDFDRIDKTPNTVNTHRFIGLASDAGKADEAVEALFRAFFMEGRDTGNPDVLSDIGTGLGLEREKIETLLRGSHGTEAIYEENARAHRLGLNGVPAFVFDDNFVISGAQEPEVLARVIDAAHLIGKNSGKL